MYDEVHTEGPRMDTDEERPGWGLIRGADAIAIDGGGDGALEQIHGDDDTEVGLRGTDDEAFDTGQGAAIDADALAGGEVGPRHDQGVGGNQRSEIVEFSIAQRGRSAGEGDDLPDAGRLQDAHSIVGVETAKQVAWKEGLFDDPGAVRPFMFYTAQG